MEIAVQPAVIRFTHFVAVYVPYAHNTKCLLEIYFPPRGGFYSVAVMVFIPPAYSCRRFFALFLIGVADKSFRTASTASKRSPPYDADYQFLGHQLQLVRYFLLHRISPQTIHHAYHILLSE
jgi:hypothetical protein